MSGRSATGNGRGGARTARGSRAEPRSRGEDERCLNARDCFALELVGGAESTHRGEGMSLPVVFLFGILNFVD